MADDHAPRLPDAPRLPRITRLALLAAVLAGAALVARALTATAYRGTSTSATVGPDGRMRSVVTETTATLFEVNGPQVLLVVTAPLVCALIVALLLRLAHRSRIAAASAWVISGLVWALSVLGALTIGPLVLPVAVALIVACAARAAASSEARARARARDQVVAPSPPPPAGRPSP